MKKIIQKLFWLIAFIVVSFIFQFTDVNFDSENISHVLILCVVFTGGVIWVLIALNKKEIPNEIKSPEKYVNLGTGIDWFKQYEESKKQTLSDFFNLRKENKIKIKAVISKTGFYQTKEGKRWTVIAKYFQHFNKNDKKEYTFYCPGFDYDPINDFQEGDSITVWVDKNDYSKYDIKAY